MTLLRIITLLFISIPICIPVQAQLIHAWDLAEFDQEGQMTFYNPDPNDAAFGAPVSSADLNGDGRAEFILSAMAADGPPGTFRDKTGEVHIYFSDGSLGGEIDFKMPSDRTVTIYGEAESDIFGIKHTAGDIDGDGLNDLLIGAFYADGNGISDAGRLYIFSSDLLTDLLNRNEHLDLAQPFPTGIRTITGSQARGRLGVWMATGDINGDGFDDIAVGADMADGFDPTHQETGRVYVYYGPLASDVHLVTADTTQAMTIIYGIDPVDHMGSCLTVGDVNGDGMEDIIIGAGALGTLRNVFDRDGGAGDGPDNNRIDSGEVRVVFGKTNMPLHLDLRSNPPGDMVSIYGGTTAFDPAYYSPDRLGEEIVTADVNGDHIDDILIGAYRADSVNDRRRDAGEVYIVYGSPTLPGRTIDMVSAPSDVTVIYGSQAGAITGDSIAAGDIDADGYDDLFIGIPGDTGPIGRRAAGGIVVIRGDTSLPHEIDIAQPNVPLIWVEGADQFDFSAYWAAAGDFDGDGHIDAMPNGMIGDGPRNERRSAGEAYVLSGKVLSSIFDGTFSSTPSVPDNIQTPTLLQNAPNPFNSGTVITFVLPAGPTSQVTIRLYNIQGKLVRTLMTGIQVAGEHQQSWDGNDDSGNPLPSGTYFCELISNGHRDYKKLVILR